MSNDLLDDVIPDIAKNAVKKDPSDRPVADSGHRRVMESGAQRDRASGKGRYDLLQWVALRGIALILEKGADKYEARNWEKGMCLSVYIDSAARHLAEYVEGLTNEDHLGQACWNLLSAIQTEEMIRRGVLPADLDDLPHYYDGYSHAESK